MGNRNLALVAAGIVVALLITVDNYSGGGFVLVTVFCGSALAMGSVALLARVRPVPIGGILRLAAALVWLVPLSRAPAGRPEVVAACAILMTMVGLPAVRKLLERGREASLAGSASGVSIPDRAPARLPAWQARMLTPPQDPFARVSGESGWGMPWRERTLPFAAAMAVQGGLAALVAGSVAAIAIAWGIAAGLVLYRAGLDRVEGMERSSKAGRVLAVLLALLLTVALEPGPPGGGDGSSPVAGSSTLLVPGKPAPRTQSEEAGDGDALAHAGVILLTEEEQPVLPPLPEAAGADYAVAERPEPFTIPFWGAYWFYRSPYKEPPPESVVLRGGDPSEQRFRATGRAAILMEARQSLGRRIALGCCQAIELAIRNADRYPRSVTIELVLHEAARAGEPIALGEAPVTSRPRWRPGQGDDPTSEVLRFPIPAPARARHFDELQVIFRMDPMREDRSARIAIERFVLVP